MFQSTKRTNFPRPSSLVDLIIFVFLVYESLLKHPSFIHRLTKLPAKFIFTPVYLGPMSDYVLKIEGIADEKTSEQKELRPKSVSLSNLSLSSAIPRSSYAIRRELDERALFARGFPRARGQRLAVAGKSAAGIIQIPRYHRTLKALCKARLIL